MNNAEIQEMEERERADVLAFWPGASAYPCGFCERCDKTNWLDSSGTGWVCPMYPYGIPESVTMNSDADKHKCMRPREMEISTGRKWKMFPDGGLQWID